MIGLSGTLLIYSFVITSLLVLAFVLYIRLIPAPRLGLPGFLANLNDQSVLSSIEKGSSTIPLNTINGFVAREQIENMYLSAMLKDLPFLFMAILFIFVFGAVILSKILHSKQEKQALLLARQLALIDDAGRVVPGHPAITKAYAEIKERLAANALDYLRLSSYVTHEQKNMLSLLRAKLQLTGNRELVEDVDRVADSLDDILILSASVHSAEMEIIDAALVCASVCDEYRKIYPDLHFDFDDSANYLIAARELWIHRAVSNLVHNAVKYGKGRIGVSAANQKGSVIISVSDEGGGLDDEALERLFDYRYRVGRLKKDGYGIGLNLVRHVCDLCGGICWVESSPTNGTIFYMVFPEALTAD
jgi:signal transduction histidine kinase